MAADTVHEHVLRKHEPSMLWHRTLRRLRVPVYMRGSRPGLRTIPTQNKDDTCVICGGNLEQRSIR